MDGQISMEEAMEMSLDEYIRRAGIKGCVSKTKKQNHSSNGNLDEDEQMPDSLSSQWRIMPPNNADREPGMPPLISINSRVSNHRNQKNNHRWKLDPNYPNESNESQVNDIQVDIDNNWYNGRRNGKSNRNRNQNQNQNNKPYKKLPNGNVQNRLKMHQKNVGFQAPNNNMSVPLNTFNPLNTLNPLNIGLFNPNLLANNNTIDNNIQNMLVPMANQFNGLRSLPGIDLMPAIAGKILEQIDAVQKNFGNKYDMKVQKEISEMQGNTLMYKCGGAGGVVSFDGPGINCPTVLHTTDSTLNMRFA